MVIKGKKFQKIRFFQGLNDEELARIENLCQERLYGAGELCQIEGQPANRIHFIIAGRVGSVLRSRDAAYSSNDTIIEVLTAGDLFGWPALIKGTPWSTLRVLDQTEAAYINSDDLIALCESNFHIGYILMKNLSALLASRLRRYRMSILNTIVALKGDL